MRLEARLRLALDQGDLALAFEPQLDSESGRIGGLECLMRWDDAELGEVGEAEAMRAAETAGIARELTWWIFNNALRQSAEFARAGLQCKLGLKLAESGLMQPDFPEFIERALRIRGGAAGTAGDRHPRVGNCRGTGAGAGSAGQDQAHGRAPRY